MHVFHATRCPTSLCTTRQLQHPPRDIILPPRLSTCEHFQYLAYPSLSQRETVRPRLRIRQSLQQPGFLARAYPTGSWLAPSYMHETKGNIRWARRSIRADGTNLADMCCIANKISCCDWQLKKPKNPVEPPSRPMGRHPAADMRTTHASRTCSVTSNYNRPKDFWGWDISRQERAA